MKSVETISLDGSVFAIESDARAPIEAYLARTEKALKGVPDKDEIMKDFENAIAAHLFEQGFSREKAASKADVEAILTKLGDAKDEAEAKESLNKQWSWLKEPFTLSKDNKLIFGLCGAIAERIGIDAIWVRLAFVLLAFLTHGFFVLLYFVVGIVMAILEDETKRVTRKGRKKNEDVEPQVGWRSVLHKTAVVVGHLIRIAVIIVSAAVFVLTAAFSAFVMITLLHTPRTDYPLFGYNRSSTVYLFVGSIIALALWFVGTIFKEVTFPSKKPVRPFSLIVIIGAVTILFTTMLTSGYYLRNDINKWIDTHPKQDSVRIYYDTQNEPTDICVPSIEQCK
jgi:phage shock protein PspC (stress-responsive transcriptional regulator)